MNASDRPAADTGGPTARSYLFVPATRTDRIQKAFLSGADAVIADLEDAVAPGDKDSAREALTVVLDPARPLIVRINSFGTEWFERDLVVCRRAGISAIMLPKAELAAQVQAVHGHCGIPVVALVETAVGMWNALDIARTPGVARMAFGALDFRLDLGLPDAGYAQLASYRAQLVLASRVAGIDSPVDSPTASIDDAAVIREDAQRARNLGFGGKLCIHPNQIRLVNAAFLPSPQEVQWAQRVVAAAFESAGAAVALDGKMIDRPVIDLAHRTLAQANRRQTFDEGQDDR